MFYDPNKDFNCIDGSAKLPFRFVNDDYCDCEDGSDEPGTAACANGIFNCANKGHVEKNLPSNRVNDGICDCCDATDEYNSSARCENNCLLLGRAAREEAARLRDILKQGSTVRSEYVQQAVNRKLENAKQLESLKKELLEAESAKQARDAQKKDAEDREKAALDKWQAAQDIEKRAREEEELKLQAEQDAKDAEVGFNELDADKNGLLSYFELQTSQKFDKDGDGTISDDEAKVSNNADMI